MDSIYFLYAKTIFHLMERAAHGWSTTEALYLPVVWLMADSMQLWSLNIGLYEFVGAYIAEMA